MFDAIHGSDGRDPTIGNFAFDWPSNRNLNGLKVGYTVGGRNKSKDERDELKVFESLGCELVEVKLPSVQSFLPLIAIIDIEAASVFDDLLRAGHTEGWNSWDEDFRAAQYVSAVDYVRVQRARSVLIEQYNDAIRDVDILVNANDLIQSNFSGHPQVVMPVGYNEPDGGGRSTVSCLLTGHLNDDELLLAIANKFQQKQSAHHQHPELDPWLKKFEDGELE